MKILYLLQQFPKMNSETFILNEMIELEKMGHDVWVLSDMTNYYEALKVHSLITENNFMEKVISGESYSRGIYKLIDFLKQLTLDFIYYPKPTFKNILFIFVNNHYYQDKNIWSKLDNYLILRKLPQIKFDIVYSPFAHIEKIDKGISIANIVGAKFTTAFRALELYGYKCRRDMFTYKKIFSGIENIATISEFNKKQLESLLGLNKKISIVHSSIDPERFKPSVKKHINGKTQIITIARFVEKKGIAYLLEALAILKKKNVPFEYTLIGDGPLNDELFKKIKELEIEDVVKILQPMKQEDVKILLEQSDIMVLPCIVAENGDRDILANVLKESMSMELPVITSDISGIEELITDHQNGLLVPEKNPDALVVAILELINNPELSEKISKAGRQQIINNFNVHEEVKKLSYFFEEIIKSDYNKSIDKKNDENYLRDYLSKKPNLFDQGTRGRCHGLLSPTVYSQIYKYAYKAQEGNMLELGSAHGAATICIAKGIIDSKKKNTLFTVEHGEGKNSSMEKWGLKEFNLSTLKNNLEYFNCNLFVTIIFEKIKEAALQLENCGPFSLMLIDADGAIDRDFILFYNLLKPGAYIIIDDYENKKSPVNYNKHNIFGKSWTIYVFVNYFIKKGLIKKEKIINNTIFCYKPQKINKPIIFNKDELLKIRKEISLK